MVFFSKKKKTTTKKQKKKKHSKHISHFPLSHILCIKDGSIKEK